MKNSTVSAFLVIILLLAWDGKAQEMRKIDSLRNSLARTTDPKVKVWTLLELSHQYFLKDFSKSMEYAKKASAHAMESGFNLEYVQAMLQITDLYLTNSDYSLALEYAYKAKEMAENIKAYKEEASSLDAIGSVYEDFGDNDKSSELYFQCLAVYEKLGDKWGIAHTKSRIGVLFYKDKNYSHALLYFNQSLKMLREIRDSVSISGTMTSIALVYIDLHDNDQAFRFLNEAYTIAKNVHDVRREYLASKNLGSLYMKLNLYNEAKQYFQTALDICTTLNNYLRVARCQINFSELYLKIKDHAESMRYAGLALDGGLKFGFPDINYEASKLLQQNYIELKDSSKAYQYALIGDHWKDSLNARENKKTLTKLELQYQYEKKDSANKIRQQRKDFFIILILIILGAGLIITFLFWTRQKIKMKNSLLTKQALEKELDYKNKELVLNVMSVMKKNELMADICTKLLKMEKEAANEETKNMIRQISSYLQKNQEEEILKEFSLRFKDVHNDFYNKLLDKFPGLTPSDLRLCAFLRLNMSSKEIAELTGQRIATLENARYRLRQKLNITNSDVNLVTFLSQF